MANALRLRRKYPISTCRDYSVTCASRLANESMDFVYLDARHDCTLHAASVLGLSLLAPFVTPSHSPAHSTDRLPFPSHVFSPGRQGRSRRPERLLAKAATRRHHGRVQTHSSHIVSPICPHVAQHPPRRENDAMTSCVPPVNPPGPLRVLQARLYLCCRRRAGGRQRRRRLDDQL